MTISIQSNENGINLINKDFEGAGVQRRERTLDEIAPPDGSTTAKEIFEFLQQHETEIKVVYVDSGTPDIISCYSVKEQTVFIRADRRYEFSEYPGSFMDPKVLLYHEFGHAVQDLDGSHQRLVAEDSRGVYTKIMKTGWVNGVKVRTPKTSNQLTEREAQIAFPGMDRKAVSEITQFKNAGYAMNLETNNMRRHEWPMSCELRLLRRSTYFDIREHRL